MTTPLMTPLATALHLRTDGPNLLAAIPGDWAQGRAAFGGLIAALGIRALARQLPAETSLRSFVIDFAGPVAPGEVEISVHPLRAGRSLSHARAQFSQDGQVRAELIGAFGTARSSQLFAAGDAPPSAPAPEELPGLPYVEGLMPAFTQHFDYRWTATAVPFSAAPRGNVGGWVRALDADRVDAAVLAALIEAFPAPILPLMPAPAGNTTVTWMVNFVGSDAAAPVDAFWRLESDTHAIGDGYASCEARIWNRAGELRAVSQQLVAEFTGPAHRVSP